ncbi:DUF1838 family protein [Moorena sp. SIO4G3]|uniref:DUF1838 family protein n=1 Tax=Moorena sp. SIO4G3 TaxID=2607821 RepID=UPI00142A1684|nr:DUF1838 family protein [Moorena sp. SIO4G3]NEO80618.1 DUF1838 domain-containing protein [Moorena sp. SIO4G3]
MKNWAQYLMVLLLVCGINYFGKQSIFAQTKSLDLNEPKDALTAYRKIFCSLTDGKPVIYWWKGQVYSRIPGEKDRHLFNIQGMNIRACGRVTDEDENVGYRLVSREVMLYLDPETNEILSTWSNPWLNREVKVFHVANDPVNGKPRFPDQTKFNGLVENGTVILNFVIPLFYPNALGGDYQNYIGGTYHAMEIFNYFLPASQLMPRTNNAVEQVNISWTRISKWLPWMEMGDRPGVLIFTGAGLRLKSWDDLPLFFQQEIETNYPLFSSPPSLDDERPNQTSWTTFKEYIDRKFIAPQN